MGFFTYTRKSIKFSDYSILLFDKEPENAFVLNEKNFNEFQEIILMINKMFDVDRMEAIQSLPSSKNSDGLVLDVIDPCFVDVETGKTIVYAKVIVCGECI